MREMYKEITFKKKSVEMIHRINGIIEQYQDEGYTLTVRQLYYQLVARDIIPNNEKSYKQITSLVNDARIGGLIDWDAIEDRTRSFERRNRWDNPKDILTASAKQFHTDPWGTQDRRIFLVVEKEALVGVFQNVCWQFDVPLLAARGYPTQDRRIFLVVEKEALVGVFQNVCWQFDVPLLAARGYPSASVVREFARTEIEHNSDKDVLILHFGDHDPSGIDMTRDLEDRFEMFGHGCEFELKRMALNYDQIEELKPPPNPAKATDARFVNYRKRFGASSWELDALPPTVLSNMARDEILAHVDTAAWKTWETGLAETREKMLKHVEKFKG
ncbi:DNA topoisomerase [Clavibacter phage 33]|nr:DNA topoisomerase [Clavibacter phage 33]